MRIGTRRLVATPCAALLALAACDRGAVMPDAVASTTWFEGRIVRTSRGGTTECWVVYGRERCTTQEITVVTDLVAGHVCSWSSLSPPVVFQIPRLGGTAVEPAVLTLRRTDTHRVIAGRACTEIVMVLPNGGEARACMDDVFRQMKQGRRAAPEDRPWTEGLVLGFGQPDPATGEAAEVTQVTLIEPGTVSPTRFECGSP